MGSSTDMPCREFVELVTAYLDGALSPADRERCDAHWRTCPGCRTYLAQMQLVVGSIGQLGRGEEPENVAERERPGGGARKRSVPLGVADERASPGDHISYFWESEDEFETTAAGFLGAGVERDEVCVLLGHAAANSRVLACLERRGLPPGDLERRDRLHTLSGRQPADAMLREIGDRVRTAVDRGRRWSASSGTSGGGIPDGPPSGISSGSRLA